MAMKRNRVVIDNVLTLTMDANKAIGMFSILIEDDRIQAVSPEKIEQKPEEIRISGEGLLAVPGFINGHIHGDVLLARGLGDGLTLYQQDNDSFVARKNWFYNELDSNMRQLSRTMQYIEALKSGTTFLCDYMFWCEEFENICTPFEKTGLDGAVVIDYRKNFLKEKRKTETEIAEYVRQLKNNGYYALLQAPSEELFDDDLLCDLKNIADRNSIGIQVHLAETTWRTALIQEKYGKSPVEYLYGLGFLDKSVSGSHGVYLSEKDIEILAAAQTGIINSPVAEMKIADGIAPVSRLFDADVPVGIGTDGALWNDSSDMFAEMKTLLLLQRVQHGADSFSANRALYAATMGGARALGIDDQYGSIETGKKANLLLLDYVKPHLVPIYHGKNSNIVENLVSCARPSDVRTVIVNGKIVVDDYTTTFISEQEVSAECQKRGTGLFRDLS